MTTYEVVSQWKRIIEDFGQFEPMTAAFLADTSAIKGSLEESPFQITVRFPYPRRNNYNMYHDNDDRQNRLVEYLSEVLNRQVAVSIELEAEDANPDRDSYLEQSNSLGRPDFQFKLDLEKDAFLKNVVETFNAQFMGSRKVKPQQGELANEHAKDDEGNAEDAI